MRGLDEAGLRIIEIADEGLKEVRFRQVVAVDDADYLRVRGSLSKSKVERAGLRVRAGFLLPPGTWKDGL